MSLAFIYYDVIFLYAIINAIRGKGIWTVSVKEVATGTPGVPMIQPQSHAAPATPYQNYGVYPPQVLLQGPPAQPYNVYSQQVLPQGPAPQPYGAYPQQTPPYGPPTIPPGQNQPNNYPPTGAPQQQANYGGYAPSPVISDAPLPSQPNYSSYPINGSQAQLPLPSGYQGPIPQQQQLPSQSVYGLHQPIPV